MPNTKTAKKALRQSERKRAMNLNKKAQIKGAVKELKKLVSEKKMDEAKKQLSVVYKKLDKTAKSDYIKKNKAARLKSKFSKLVNPVK